MSGETQSHRVTTRQREVLLDCLRTRIQKLATMEPREHGTYKHGGRFPREEAKILARIYKALREQSLPYTLSITEAEWPALSRALRDPSNNPVGYSLYQTMNRTTLTRPAWFTFTEDRALRAVERRQLARKRPLGRPRKSWGTGETLFPLRKLKATPADAPAPWEKWLPKK